MALGLYNFFNERKKEKVILKVIPIAVKRYISNNHILTSTEEFLPSEHDDKFGIKIINFSTFSVTINQVGFSKVKKIRMAIPLPILGDSEGFPRKLEPRNSFTVYGSIESILQTQQLHLVKRAYAETSCGTSVFGQSKALKDFVKWGKQLNAIGVENE